jgi:predicted glycosyltransferase
MRVWFDLANSPHVTLFAPLIADLTAEGTEVVISCRKLANTVDLIAQEGLDYTVVGRHYGAGRVAKLTGFPVRVVQLGRFARRARPNVSVSQSSFYAPVAALAGRIPSLYMNDNEHAKGNIPAFLTASRVLVPEHMPEDAVRHQCARKAKVIRYPGVKEGLYLWRLADGLPARPQRERPRIYVRPEPWTAQYYRAEIGFLPPLVRAASAFADVIVLPRDAAQADAFRDAGVDPASVRRDVAPMAEIAADCDLFIGAGGTMTREMAVLGVPTISVYRAELLGVDRYLISIGAMRHQPQLTADRLRAELEHANGREPVTSLLDAGRAGYAMLRTTIEELAA